MSESYSKGEQRTCHRSWGLILTEAVGKTVAFVNVINDPPCWQALEIRFTDGTLLHFEFVTTYPKIKPEGKSFQARDRHEFLRVMLRTMANFQSSALALL
jgi:hypothetical protein